MDHGQNRGKQKDKIKHKNVNFAEIGGRGGDLGGTGGDGPPKKFEVGDGPCIRPPQYFEK